MQVHLATFSRTCKHSMFPQRKHKQCSKMYMMSVGYMVKDICQTDPFPVNSQTIPDA